MKENEAPQALLAITPRANGKVNREACFTNVGHENVPLALKSVFDNAVNQYLQLHLVIVYKTQSFRFSQPSSHVIKSTNFFPLQCIGPRSFHMSKVPSPVNALFINNQEKRSDWLEKWY